VLLQMAVVLTFASKQPVVKVGRMAGQFAKPRSSPTERIGGVELPSYFGDIINGIDFTPESRIPDPQRMLQAYGQAAATLNLLRAFATGGYANLRQVHQWTLDHIGASPGPQSSPKPPTASARRSTSWKPAGSIRDRAAASGHQLLHQPRGAAAAYEQAMTRQDSLTGDWYDTSAHMLWIGDRTRFEGSAHVEFLRGVGNPIGMKCGPSLDARRAAQDARHAQPRPRGGRMTLISRFGNDKVRRRPAPLVRAVAREGHPVVWSCDPMHGNVIKAESAQDPPVRPHPDEVKGFFEVHRAEGTHAGGIHIEMTGQDVTECTGGAIAITDEGAGRPLPHPLRSAPQCRRSPSNLPS
jgi:3-deoxy-7-phosphoheptulonate synthase